MKNRRGISGKVPKTAYYAKKFIFAIFVVFYNGF